MSSGYPQTVATKMTSSVLSARAWPLRLARVLTAALVATTLAATAHRLAGGMVAPIGVLAGVFAVIAAVALLLSGRRMTGGQLFAMLLLAQGLFHASCVMGSDMDLTGPMILSHFLACLLTAKALQRGESWLWLLAERLGLPAWSLFDHFADLPVARQQVQRIARRSIRTADLQSATGLRGPPIRHA